MGPFFFKTGAAQPKFDKSVFYEVMASGDLDAVNQELAKVAWAQTNLATGYMGALLMKKAGLLAKPKQRLKFFKEGRIQLETALLADKENTEFHFLRLAIEEHAPKIVKYHTDIANDKLIIEKNFKNLPLVLRQAILDYCKNSKVLQAANFQP